MIVNVDASNPTIGNVKGVQVWSMPTYSDERGRLFKAYTTADSGVFPIPFKTYEHVFSESNKNVFRGMHFQIETSQTMEVRQTQHQSCRLGFQV
jgi:dTDP-4-dehydrorhamnose 3,5-epimerase-like enzyme